MTRTYFNHKAARWDEAATERDQTKLGLMAERLNLKPGARVLDVGTGTGIFIPFLLREIGSGGQIIALDVAEEMLKRARAKSFNGEVHYLNADVTSMPLRAESFDGVVCYSSFPHFPDKEKALLEINRVTKSGGCLFICHTSGRVSLNEFHRGIPEVKDDFLPDDDEMRQLLSRAGFVVVRIEWDGESYLCCARKP
jgi:ubiquinone/menaquinone biosynthesis C-methylase UbiE